MKFFTAMRNQAELTIAIVAVPALQGSRSFRKLSNADSRCWLPNILSMW